MGQMKELRLRELRGNVGTALDCIAEQAGPPEEVLRVAGLLKQMTDLGWEMTAPKRARLLSVLAIAKGGHDNSSAARFGATLLRVSERPATRVIFSLHRTKGIQRDAFEGELIPAVTTFAKELSGLTQDIQFGLVAQSPVQIAQGFTSDQDLFQATMQGHEFKAGSTYAAKALRKALELFRQETIEFQPMRLIFNSICGAIDNVKDAHKAFQRLDAEGVLVVGVAIAPTDFQQLQQCSSPGLAFQVTGITELKEFLEKAAREVER